MKLTVLRKMGYNDTYIYVLNYSTMFQYLFTFKDEIYQHHIFLKPSLIGRIKGLFGYPMYTKEELDYGEQVVLSGAMKSLDTLFLNTATDSLNSLQLQESELIPVNK